MKKNIKKIINKDVKENKKENKRVYLDFASQTMIDKDILSEMKKISKYNFNPASIYDEGIKAQNILNEARDRIAKVFGVKSHEIYFCNNSTQSCATAILGTFLFYKNNFLMNKNSSNKYIKPHIITSNIEHASVLENIKYLENLGEIEVTYIKSNEFGIINVEDIIKEIKDNTILISIMYVNNEVGTIQDIKNISKGIKDWKQKNKNNLLKEKDNNYPYFHTDASQAGNYLSLYIQTLGVDMLSLNGSKIYGPKSSAILMKKEYINISPIYFGGGQERNIFSGTIDIEKCFGIAIAIEKAQSKINNKKFLESIAEKRNFLLKNILKNIPESVLIGAFNENEWKKDKMKIKKSDREEKRIPNNISIWLPNFLSDEMVIRLDEKGFSVSAGSACSAKDDNYSHVIFNIINSSNFKNLNLKNKNDKKLFAKKVAKETIRITINHNTKIEDLERFVKILKEIYFKYKGF